MYIMNRIGKIPTMDDNTGVSWRPLNNRQQESSALFVIPGFIMAVLISIPQHWQSLVTTYSHVNGDIFSVYESVCDSFLPAYKIVSCFKLHRFHFCWNWFFPSTMSVEKRQQNVVYNYCVFICLNQYYENIRNKLFLCWQWMICTILHCELDELHLFYSVREVWWSCLGWFLFKWTCYIELNERKNVEINKKQVCSWVYEFLKFYPCP